MFRPDLEQVGVAVDQFHLAGVHDLGDDRHFELVADAAEDSEALFPHPLEAIGAGSRLECPAAEDVGAGRLDRAADLEQDLLSLDGAGTGDHQQRAPPDGHSVAEIEDGIVLLELAAGELERFEDRHDVLDAGDRTERRVAETVLFANHADERALGTAAHIVAEAHLLNLLEEVLELGLGAVWFEDDDHI
jgi:hypothetical protein